MSITYCEWVFLALVVQHAMRIRHACGLPPIYNIFYTLNYKGTIFEKEKLLKSKCVF